MGQSHSREREVFEKALGLSGASREEYLAGLGRDDPALANRIRKLIEADERATQSELEQGVASIRDRAAKILKDPDTIGPYRVLERLGEGGMGVVYLAEQTQPVQRKVAIKIVKVGMDTKELIARFSSERQALALMNHPNIARILEAGATDEGRPYFIMEYVPGISINQYCDKMRLDLDQRLQLFQKVCQAVQHAHQKGVIHRDLKPSNILVTEDQGHPTPKIIDFGVAKAMGQRLTDLTMHTGIGYMIGTLEYMSPEQSESSALSVDTRSDVYSLGAVLYELIVGERPFEKKDNNDSVEALKRRIQSEEPDSPRERLTTLERGRVETIARSRATSARTLRREVGGELGWITNTALAKDPARRYQSAKTLADDINAYLTGEVISAGPDELSYRLSSLVRRNKAAVVASLIVILALSAGLIFSAVGFVQASRERDLAQQARDESEAVIQFLSNMLTAADPEHAGRDVTVREVLDAAAVTLGEDFKDRPLLQARVHGSIGETYMGLGMLDEAESHLAQRLEIYEQFLSPQHADYIDALFNLGRVSHRLGRYDDAEGIYSSVLETQRDEFGLEHPGSIRAMNNLALVYGFQGRLQESARLREQVLELDIKLHGADSPDAFGAMNNLAASYRDLGRAEEARSLLSRAVEGRSELFGPDHPATIMVRNNYAAILHYLDRSAESVVLLDGVIRDASRVYGEQDWRTLISRNQLGLSLAGAGRLEEAETELLQTWRLRANVLGEPHPETLVTAGHYGGLLNQLEKYAQAQEVLRTTVSSAQLSLPPNSPILAEYRAQLGLSLLGLGNGVEAERELLEAREPLIQAVTNGATRYHAISVALNEGLSGLYHSRGDNESAAAFEIESTNIEDMQRD